MGRMTNRQHAAWIQENRTGNLTVAPQVSHADGLGPFGTITATVTPADGSPAREVVLADMNTMTNREHPLRNIVPGDQVTVRVSAWGGDYNGNVERTTLALGVTGNPSDEVTVEVTGTLAKDREEWFLGADFRGAVNFGVEV